MVGKTPKEAQEAVYDAIQEISKKYKVFGNNDEMIQKVCRKYKISETHVRTVGGWLKGYIES